MHGAVERYRELRRDVDKRAAELLRIHDGQIACRPGCSRCCTNISVFPVEYQAILQDLCAAGIKEISFDPNAPCVFLQDGLCALYEYRPLICRTHGLPIAFAADESDPESLSVSFCPHNFVRADVDGQIEFGPENTLSLEELNGRLFEVHEQFLREFPDMGWGPESRIPLRRIAEDLAAWFKRP
jgi:Fe-S-cluster containining protein